jgi:uncharacterized protein YeaO (DUF488 family)
MTKETVAIEEWIKASRLAPRCGNGSGTIRRRYADEVRKHPEQFGRLRALAQQGPITLVFSAHDEAHNDAVVLRDLLMGRRVRRKLRAT